MPSPLKRRLQALEKRHDLDESGLLPLAVIEMADTPEEAQELARRKASDPHSRIASIEDFF